MNQHIAVEATDRTGTLYNSYPDDPIMVMKEWLTEARVKKVNQPGAFALATVNSAGHSSSRIVQTLEVRTNGIVFASHVQSQKGRDIVETGQISAVYFWPELNRQLTFSGCANMLDSDESNALWQKRSQDTYAVSTLSKQSEILNDEQAFRIKLKQLVASAIDWPRPDCWQGYLLIPDRMEFWEGAADRLHHRLRYDLINGSWQYCRLQP